VQTGEPVDEGAQLYHEPRYKESPAMGEGVVNLIGHELLRNGSHDKALTSFELSTKAFPGSANTYDSMGEACEAMGDLARAVECYQKALEVLPGNTTRSEEACLSFPSGLCIFVIMILSSSPMYCTPP
jgi:tetratricopeptide (TPR) repeat protein